MLKRTGRKYAIYSGYELSREEFERLIKSIPILSAGFEHLNDDLYDFAHCFSMYNLWTNKGAPRMIPLDDGNTPNIDPNIPFSEVSSCFFPVRCVNYTGKAQLENAAQQPFSLESEQDKAWLKYFVEFTQSVGGVLDTNSVEFRWVKMRHPNRSEKLVYQT